MSASNASVIIVAAGSGRRFGSELPKQFCLLGDKPVVMHSMERIARHMPSSDIILVLSADRMDFWRQLCRQYAFGIPHKTVAGGTTRWESVKNALEQVSADSAYIYVHDGARPLVSASMLNRLQAGLLTGSDGVLPVLGVTDSLRQSSDGVSSSAVDRSQFYAVQTPQAFPAEILHKSYQLPYCAAMTDDASVVEAAGYHNIIMCEGDAATLKITGPLDIEIAALYLKKSM